MLRSTLVQGRGFTPFPKKVPEVAPRGHVCQNTGARLQITVSQIPWESIYLSHERHKMWTRGGHKVWRLLGLQPTFIEIQLFHSDSYEILIKSKWLKIIRQTILRDIYSWIMSFVSGSRQQRFSGERVPGFLSRVRRAYEVGCSNEVVHRRRRPRRLTPI